MNPQEPRDSGVVRVSLELALDPPAAFDLLMAELGAALARAGMRLEPRQDGQVVAEEREVGRIVSWKPGERILIEWHPADWQPEDTVEIEWRFEPADGGTRVVLEQHGWGRLVGDSEELAGWFAGQMVAPLLRVMTPQALGDWLTDRRARRPSGAQACAVYGNPLYHYPNFRVILAELALRPEDHLIEVGCGGGALLQEALQSGCRAAAIDHSADMVQLTKKMNEDAVAEGRLEVRQASAERLPFPDATFSCAAMTGVLGFLSDPVGVLAEIRRVLGPTGRLVALGSDPELRGTPAAPEPMASRLRFYEDEQLVQLARKGGFEEVRVVRRDLEPFAREVGIPEEHVSLFSGTTPFLIARRA